MSKWSGAMIGILNKMKNKLSPGRRKGDATKISSVAGVARAWTLRADHTSAAQEVSFYEKEEARDDQESTKAL